MTGGAKHMKSLRIYYTEKNNGVALSLLLIAAIAAAVLSICMGSVNVSLAEIYAALAGGAPDKVETHIVLYARLPRTCGCLLAGASLAVSGAVIQSVLANPLAAPNIIGVNSGAGMAVVICAALFPHYSGLYPVFAFVGALFGVLLVLFIAEKTGASKTTLVLSGVAVSSVFSAITDGVITFVPDVLNGYSDFRIGGFSNLAMSRVIPALWVVIPALIILLLLSNDLDILSLGMETASSLGLSSGKLRIAALALSAALAGAAVSFAGLLGFVGLIVPHIIRRILGECSAPLIVGSALGGAALLTLCDTLARLIFAPYELPVGVVLSLIGGPFFIWLLIKQRGGRMHD